MARTERAAALEMARTADTARGAATAEASRNAFRAQAAEIDLAEAATMLAAQLEQGRDELVAAVKQNSWSAPSSGKPQQQIGQSRTGSRARPREQRPCLRGQRPDQSPSNSPRLALPR